MQPTRLLINYRTSDTANAATQLARRLKRDFGEQVFLDHVDIRGGDRWELRLLDWVTTAGVMFALIGKDWLSAFRRRGRPPGRNADRDWVKFELEKALSPDSRTIVVPVLVDGATLPRRSDMPASIRPLMGRQWKTLRTSVAFDEDVHRLLEILAKEGFERSAAPGRYDPESVYAEVELDRFVPRNRLVEDLDKFLAEQPCGYFLVEGPAGCGKTAFLADLVRARGYFPHFMRQAKAPADVLRSLAAHIGPALGIEDIADLVATIGTRSDSDFWDELLKRVSARRRPPGSTGRDADRIVVVIDGLDEAPAPERGNVLGLPRRLPDGVYFVVSQRPTDVPLAVDAPWSRHPVNPASPENLQAIEEYAAALGFPKPTIAELVERFEGNWVYVLYVSKELGKGRLGPGRLPRGLWRYYASSFLELRRDDATAWARARRVLCALGAARERISARVLADLSDTNEDEVLPLLAAWRPYLSSSRQKETERVALYHETLAEFAGGALVPADLTAAEREFADELRAATIARHAAIARGYLKRWGGPGLERLRSSGPPEGDGYGWRHLVWHLAAAGDTRQLTALLRAEWSFESEIRTFGPSSWFERLAGRRKATARGVRSAWFEVHARSGDLAQLQEDWATAERYARGEPNEPELVALRVDAMLALAAEHDRTIRLPTGLLGSLVREGRWSPEQAMRLARRNRGGAEVYADLLSQILARHDVDRSEILREARGIIESFPKPFPRVLGAIRLLERCSDEERRAVARTALDAFVQLEAREAELCGPRLAPLLGATERAEYFEALGRFDPRDRLRVLAASARNISGDPQLAKALEKEVAASGTYCALAYAAIAYVWRDERGRAFAKAALELLLQEHPEDLVFNSQVRRAWALLAEVRGLLLSPEDLDWIWKYRIDKILTASRTGGPPNEVVARVDSAFQLAPAGLLRGIEQKAIRRDCLDACVALAARYAEVGEQDGALRLAGKIDVHYPYRVHALARMAPHLDEHGVRRALAMLDVEPRPLLQGMIDDLNVRRAEEPSEALAALLPRLAEVGAPREAVARMRALRLANSRLWWRTANAVAPHVSGEALDELLRQSLELGSESARTFLVLSQFSPYLPVEKVRVLARATAAMPLAHLSIRASAANSVAVRLAGLGCEGEALAVVRTLLSDAMDARQGLDLNDCFADLLLASTKMVAGLLDIAARQFDQKRPALLEELAPYLTAEHFARAHKVASRIGESAFRLWGLAAIVGSPGQPSPSEAASAIYRGLDAGLSDFPFDRPRIVGLLAPFVGSALDECRRLVQGAAREGLVCLAAMARAAPQSVPRALVDEAIGAYGPVDRLKLSAVLPAGVFCDTLASVIASHLPKTPDEDLALASARLAALGDPIAAFTVAWSIGDLGRRARAARKVEGLERADRKALLSLWRSVPCADLGHGRAAALGLVGALLPLVHAIGGPAAIATLYETVSRWDRWSTTAVSREPSRG